MLTAWLLAANTSMEPALAAEAAGYLASEDCGCESVEDVRLLMTEQSSLAQLPRMAVAAIIRALG